MKNFIKPKAVFFDWDGTLVNSFPGIHKVWCKTLAELGYQETWTYEQTIENSKLSWRETFPKIFGDNWESARDHFYKNYKSLNLEELLPFEDSFSLLSALSNQGIPMALVSNKRGDDLRREVDYFGWDDFFNSTIGSGDCAHEKPAPDMILKALKNSDLEGGPDVWYVGDMIVDIKAAQKAQCQAVLIRTPFDKKGDFAHVENVLHFQDGDSLKRKVLSLLQLDEMTLSSQCL